MANNSDINNVILGYDKNMRDNYHLFSFLEESQNEYTGVGKYNDNITDFLNNFKPYILSESNPKCNITKNDKDNYELKINILETIINKCNATTVDNKQKCLYDEFMKEPTIILVKDLTAIVKKINKECIFANVTSETITNICRDNSNNVLNKYTNNKILLTQDFLNKYTTIISDLKKIADTNSTEYLTKCNQDPARIKTYNDTQQLLSNALFAINPSSECTPEKICTQNICSNQIGIKTQITDLNNQIKSLKDNSSCPAVTNDLFWNSELSMRNGFVISCIIIFFIIVIIVLIVLIARNSNKSSEYNMTSVTSAS
jgi:hypothetical protein